MINHARTLLLNLAGPAEADERPGSEYIPPYAPVSLGKFQPLRDVLFGTSPDTEGLLYRTAQYMAFLHATDHVESILKLDPRFTYDAYQPHLLPARIQTVDITGSRKLKVEGTAVGQPFVGRAKYRWDIQATGLTDVAITDPNGTKQHLALSLQTRYSIPFKLAEPNLWMRFDMAGGLTPGEVWTVQYRVAPEPSLDQVLEKTKTLSLDGLFGDQEPYKSFGNLYRQHPTRPLQLVGLLLALIYRTEELRVG